LALNQQQWLAENASVQEWFREDQWTWYGVSARLPRTCSRHRY